MKGLTPAEALWAITRGAAGSLRMDGEIGVLTPGARADLFVLDAHRWEHIVYRYGSVGAAKVVIDGQEVDLTGEG